jgi:prepilin-type N-terminal cleavage/methylation domain-containing protein
MRPARRPAGPTTAEQPDDAGFTLIELLVVLGIMSVVMAITTAGTLGLYSTFNATLRVQEAQGQVGRAFLQLDSELRYAADVRTQTVEGITSAYPVLVYLVAADVVRCYALSFEGDRLRRRTWQLGTAVPPPTAAEALAAGVVPIAGVAPFTVTAQPTDQTADGGTGATTAMDVTIALAVTTGPGGSTHRDLSSTFTAPNTEWGSDASLDDCTS